MSSLNPSLRNSRAAGGVPVTVNGRILAGRRPPPGTASGAYTTYSYDSSMVINGTYHGPPLLAVYAGTSSRSLVPLVTSTYYA